MTTRRGASPRRFTRCTDRREPAGKNDYEHEQEGLSPSAPTESADAPFLSIVIVSLNGASVLPACLESIERLDWPYDRLEVIVVNNGSRDATRDIAEAWRDRRVRPVHLPRNRGFAGGNNEGLLRAKGDWVVLLNDDTELDPSWGRRLMEEAREHPGAGVLGSLLLYPDRRTVQHAGGILRPNALTDHIGSGETDSGQFERTVPCDYVTGACFAIRRDVLEKVGLLDPGYWPIYFEEIDYCRRVREAGYEVLTTPARCIHHESRTTVAYSPGFLKKYHRNRLRFVALNYTPREIARWARAEARWLRGTWKWLPRRLLLEVYLRGCLLGPGWMVKRWRRRLEIRRRFRSDAAGLGGGRSVRGRSGA